MWSGNVSEMLSEAVKILKGEYTVRAIRVHNMDKAIVFCRTKVDCDNMEAYLNKAGGGKNPHTNGHTHHLRVHFPVNLRGWVVAV